MLFSTDVAQPGIQPETLFHIGQLPVTNAMLFGVVLTVVLFFFSLIIGKRAKLRPGKGQTIMEMLIEGFINMLEQITGNRENAMKMLPLVGGIFVFFGLSNLITLVPGITSITYDGVALFRGPTNDFNMTFTVALAVVILSHIGSMRAFGLFGHLGKFLKFKELFAGFRKGIGGALMGILDFVMGLLDIISEFAKIFSLSLRLFGNMYAGEVLAALLLGGFAIAIPSVWMAMNILVGVIQAIVFGALTAAYYSLAVQQMEAVVAD